MNTIKTLSTACMLLLLYTIAPAQTVKPCNQWLTDFIQVIPKMNDGSGIDKYVARQLQSDTMLKSSATCMIGLKVYVNCQGQFSYEELSYRNNAALKAQCDDLLKSAEAILNRVKTLSPGTIEGSKKDFTFKLIVKIKHNGKPATEVLY